MNRKKGTVRVLPFLIGGISIGIAVGWSLAPAKEEKESPLLVASIEKLTEAVERVEKVLIDNGNRPRFLRRDSDSGIIRIPMKTLLEDDLGTRFEALESAIGELVNLLSSRSGGSAPVREAKALNFVGTYPANVSALGTLEPLSEVERTLTYLDWDYYQVLSHFGSPTFTNAVNGSVNFYYAKLPGEFKVRVGFKNGRVIELDRWKD